VPNPLQPYDATDNIRDTGQDIAGINRASTSGQGNLLSVPIPMYPAPYADLVTTTSGTLTPLWAGQVDRIFPTLSVQGLMAAEAGTTGELVVEVEGVQVGPTIAIGDGVFAFWQILQQPWPDGVFISTTVTVAARRLTGAGTVRVGLRFARAEPTTS
jgi:hypothetical protein